MMNYEFIVESLYAMYDRQGDDSESEKAIDERIARHEEAENIITSAFCGQFVKCEHLGDWNKGVSVWGISKGLDSWTLNDNIEALAIKDGVDYVRFDDGSYGVIAYYNGRQDILRYSVSTEDEYNNFNDEEE